MIGWLAHTCFKDRAGVVWFALAGVVGFAFIVFDGWLMRTTASWKPCTCVEQQKHVSNAMLIRILDEMEAGRCGTLTLSPLLAHGDASCMRVDRGGLQAQGRRGTWKHAESNLMMNEFTLHAPYIIGDLAPSHSQQAMSHSSQGRPNWWRPAAAAL
jgi:hypothetical protein